MQFLEQSVDWLYAFSMTETAAVLNKALVIGYFLLIPVYLLALKISDIMFTKIKLYKKKRRLMKIKRSMQKSA